MRVLSANTKDMCMRLRISSAIIHKANTTRNTPADMMVAVVLKKGVMKNNERYNDD